MRKGFGREGQGRDVKGSGQGMEGLISEQEREGRESGSGQGLMEWNLNLNTVRYNKRKGCYTLGYYFRGMMFLVESIWPEGPG